MIVRRNGVRTREIPLRTCVPIDLATRDKYCDNAFEFGRLLICIARSLILKRSSDFRGIYGNGLRGE